ncbi:hypothetical protein [Sphaerochaeta sp. PS]|nr:hypothetical protein [Sphaerochaeta sp. PS]MDT4763156.1 hypothetical protein [Sphaerochaeta sp. PS]
MKRIRKSPIPRRGSLALATSSCYRRAAEPREVKSQQRRWVRV